MTYTKNDLKKMLEKTNWAKCRIADLMLGASARNTTDELPIIINMYKAQLRKCDDDILLLDRLINTAPEDIKITKEESDRLYSIYVGYSET